MAFSSEGNALQFNLDLNEEFKGDSVEMMVGRDGDEDSSQFSMSPREQHDQETEMCLRMFETWAQTRQTEFVEQVIARMSFNQHEHLYTILMPMLQRDFIAVLPSKWLCVCHRVIALSVAHLLMISLSPILHAIAVHATTHNQQPLYNYC